MASQPITKVYIDLSRLCLTPFTTGIQRVAKAVVLRMLKNPKLDVVLLCDLPCHTQWRILPHDAFITYYTKQSGSPYGAAPPITIAPDALQPDAVFFDIDSAWNMPMRRSWLFPKLRQRGVTIVSHLYDLIPVTEPQYFHQNTATQFLAWTSAVLQYANHIICNAYATKDALHTLCGQLSLTPPPCTVIPLGGDFAPQTDSKEQPDAALMKHLSKYRYVLMVGTIEPRKNHALVLDAVDALSELGIRVVFAGRIGWNMEEFAQKMKQHPKNGSDFFFADTPSDATIHALYENALAVVFPTKNEGFGLPIVEAFRHGTPVLASDIPVLREVGGEIAVYFDHTSTESLLGAVKALLADEAAYQQKRSDAAAYRPRTWDETAEDMADALCTIAPMHGTAPHTPLRQMVVLTARNQDLLRTLPYWDAYLPFIEELLVCCPSKNIPELKEAFHGRIRLRFFTDEELLGDIPLPQDHTMRNFFLRCLLMQKAPLDDVFIMTDDDYRPLMPLDETFFRKNGRYQAYYCYDLCQWNGTQGNYTSYDLSMFRTAAFLNSQHLPTLQYSSHQPQIIDRKLYLSMLEQYPDIATTGLDEWSSYFNYAIAKEPAMFYAQPYCSMCWPGAITDWQLWCMPQRLCFENFYDVLYEEGQVFEGLSKEFHPDTVQREHMEKIDRWHRMLRRQSNQTAAHAMYEAYYRAMYHTQPQLMLAEDDEHPARFALPQLIVLPTGSLVRLTLQAADSLRNSNHAVLRYGIQSPNGSPITPMHTLPLCDADPSRALTILLSTPVSPVSGMLVLEYQSAQNSALVTGSLPCVIAALDGIL